LHFPTADRELNCCVIWPSPPAARRRPTRTWRWRAAWRWSLPRRSRKSGALW